MFCKETDFQDSAIGEIPEEWVVKKISDTTKVVTGGTPNTKCPEFFGGETRWLKSGDIKHLYAFDTTETLTKSGIENSNAKIYPAGSVAIALSGRGQTRGRTTVTRVPMSCSQSVAFLIPNSDLIPEYLHYNLSSRYKEIRNLTGDLDRSGLNLKIVGDIRVPIPSLSEQRAIVGVLGVVDSALQLTDQVIAKTERLKRGLMQQLLTHGIGHTEFKETPIGKIPKNWGVDKLGNLVELRSNKGVNNLEKIAFIPMELVPDQQIFVKYELRAREDVKSSTYCEAGDLLLAKITPSLENGKQGIVPLDVTNGVALATTEVFPLKCTGINKFFLFYILKHSQFRNQIIASMIGTTGRQRASKESLERLEIPVPPPNEQQRIAEIFFEVDKKLELETAEKKRLERIKRGLMDLLLTGKVRIKVD